MKKLYILFLSLLSTAALQAQSITFEDLMVPASGQWKGQNALPKDSGFQSGVGFFVNSWDTSWGGTWSGWGFSNRKDSVTLSYASNELAAIAGAGNNNSNNYAVAYQSYNPAINRIRLPKYYLMGWMYLTNTTITYRAMQNGDGFAKKFGGPTGTDPDYFKVRFTGWLNGTPKTDTVDFYLADFRDTNSTNDYIVKDWTICNLSALGYCDSLTFLMESSDTSAFGMNTPAYFCVDDMSLIFVGLEEISAESPVQVYPNPIQDACYIHNRGDDVLQADILNLHGQSIWQGRVAPYSKLPIDARTWAAGTYLIRLNDGTKTYYKKLLKP